MPRSMLCARQNGVAYCWIPEIAELWAEHVQARGRFQSVRRRWLRDEKEIFRRHEAYRETRRTLQQRIKIAKAHSWMDLVRSVESDPWERPYRIAMKKLHPRDPPLTTFLAEVICTLFPPQDDNSLQPRISSTWTVEWRVGLGVADDEMLDATNSITSRNVAPGSNRDPGQVWAETIRVMAPRLGHLYTRYLREEAYRRIWRTAR